MVILSAQRMQRLAERLQQLERSVESGGGELEAVAARAGVELKTARRMDAVTLSRALAGSPGGSGRLWAAAEILFMDGLAARARGEQHTARSRWEKAAFLYRHGGMDVDLPDDATPPEERLARIEEAGTA